jgi:hypothetical protein
LLHTVVDVDVVVGLLVSVLLATELDQESRDKIESETAQLVEDERRRNSGEPARRRTQLPWWSSMDVGRGSKQSEPRKTHLKMASASKVLHCCKSLFALQRVLLRSGLGQAMWRRNSN